MTENSPLVRVHVNIEISAAALQAVVANSKRKTGADESGRYRVDTADALADMISKFLQQKGFEDFARNPENY